MNRTLLISVVSILAILGLYFLWENNHQSPSKPWDLVPEEAVIAYECHANSANDPTLSLTRDFLPDSLRSTVLEANELLLSVHILDKKETGIVVYFPATVGIDVKINSGLRSSRLSHERVFDGIKITEYPFGGKVISISLINGVWVMSSSSLLIEDIIRLSNANEGKNFVGHHREIFQSVHMKSDSGNVYLDFSQMANSLDLFLSGANKNPILNHFAKSAIVESKKQKQNLLMNGFAFDSLSDQLSTLSIFNHQKPVRISLQTIVSNRCGLLTLFGISDFTSWNQDRLEFCKAADRSILDSLNTLEENGFSANQFYGTLGDEIGVCQSGIFSGEVLVAELKDKAQAASLLQKLNRKKELNQPVSETFSRYQIHFLRFPMLTRTLFWPVTNQKMSYYVLTDHHLILAEELEDLKSFVNDIDTENTWGKSSEWNEFLSSSQDTNVGIIINALTWWPSIRNSLNQNWRTVGDSTHFFNLDKGSFQFSRLEKNYYFNGVLKFNQKKSKPKSEARAKMMEVKLPQAIGSPLTVVRNHTSGRSELLVQDESGTLRLFSGTLKTLFTVKITGKIRSQIHQIDFFKNRKLQYLFATDHELWLVDRLGKIVTGFPKKISGKSPVRSLSVIDYDHTKNYRYLIADAKGTLAQFDHDGSPANDWKKVELKEELLTAPRPLRLMGKDYLVALTRDGTLHCFNRHGESSPGFPVNLKMRPSGKWIFESSNDREVITVLSEDGVIVQIDLGGNLIAKTNLVKSSAGSHFSLVPSVELAHYVVSRIDKNKIAVLTNKGELIFETENPGSEGLFLSYFELVTGTRLFAFTDPQQEFTYFFDDKGNAIFPGPLENEGAPAVIGDKPGEEYFYGFVKNKLRSLRAGLTQD